MEVNILQISRIVFVSFIVRVKGLFVRAPCLKIVVSSGLTSPHWQVKLKGIDMVVVQGRGKFNVMQQYNTVSYYEIHFGTINCACFVDLHVKSALDSFKHSCMYCTQWIYVLTPA